MDMLVATGNVCPKPGLCSPPPGTTSPGSPDPDSSLTHLQALESPGITWGSLSSGEDTLSPPAPSCEGRESWEMPHNRHSKSVLPVGGLLPTKW